MKLFEKSHWMQLRRDYMEAARHCRDTLTNRESHWAYSPDDERTKMAVGNWVARARVAHLIAMGRRPVIGKAIIIDGAGASTGSIHAA